MRSPCVHPALLTVTADEYMRNTPSIDLRTPTPPLTFTNVPPDSALNLDVFYQGNIRLIYHHDRHDIGPMYSKMTPEDVATLDASNAVAACRGRSRPTCISVGIAKCRSYQ